MAEIMAETLKNIKKKKLMFQPLCKLGDDEEVPYGGIR